MAISSCTSSHLGDSAEASGSGEGVAVDDAEASNTNRGVAGDDDVIDISSGDEDDAYYSYCSFIMPYICM
jgi:hypothetical protein